VAARQATVPRVTIDELTALVRTAHADAWEVEGRVREPYGGGWARMRGARLMASGIPQAKWNNADITAADADLEAVSAWYDARDVPWGLRVPLGLEVALGRPLFIKRCVGIVAGAFVPLEPSAVVRRARADEFDLVARLDAAPFGGDLEQSGAWVAPQLGAPGFRHWIVEARGPAGLATTVRSDGDAGPAVYLTGVGAFDRGGLDALVTTAVAAAFADGARLVHANPDDDAEAARLARLGGVEVAGFEVRVVRER
jgi:hypothetical protein